MPELKEDPFLTPPIIAGGRKMSANKTGHWRSARPVIHDDKCTGCMLCWKYCPEACVGLTDKVPVIDLSFCKGCGICAKECPPRCIALAAEEGE